MTVARAVRADAIADSLGFGLAYFGCGIGRRYRSWLSCDCETILFHRIPLFKLCRVPGIIPGAASEHCSILVCCIK